MKHTESHSIFISRMKAASYIIPSLQISNWTIFIIHISHSCTSALVPLYLVFLLISLLIPQCLLLQIWINGSNSNMVYLFVILYSLILYLWLLDILLLKFSSLLVDFCKILQDQVMEWTCVFRMKPILETLQRKHMFGEKTG